MTAMGYGFPVQYSYARAMYGSDDMARLSSELGTSNLSGLARGGAFFSFGAILNDDDRIAFSYNSSSALGYITPGVMRTASNFGFGYTHQFSDDLVVGVNYGLLNEQSGLLGASYGQNSAVGFGNSNSTNTMGLSMGYLIDKNNSFLLEAGFANTSGSSANGLFAGTTDIQSRSYGATFMTKNLMVMEDRLTLSVKQPLRVESGSVMMVTPTVDVTTGVAKFNREMVGLRPDAREIDLTASYFTPIGKTQSLSLNVGYMKDAYNISGNHNAIISGSWMLNF